MFFVVKKGNLPAAASGAVFETVRQIRGEEGGGREKKRERECVCMCVCVCMRARFMVAMEAFVVAKV